MDLPGRGRGAGGANTWKSLQVYLPIFTEYVIGQVSPRIIFGKHSSFYPIGDGQEDQPLVSWNVTGSGGP